MSKENLKEKKLNKSRDEESTEGYKDDCIEDKQIYKDMASFEKDDDEPTNESTEEGQKNEETKTSKSEETSEKKNKESKEDKKIKTQKLKDSSIQKKSSSNQKKQDNSLVNTNNVTNIVKLKKGTNTNPIKINIRNKKSKSSKQNHDPSNNEINLINNKQNLHNQNQVHNNQKSYIVYVFENKINFPEKELFFGALRKKENIEDFFPKDIIYILIGEEDLQNGDHKYYYKNILINEIYSILKRKDEKIFILIDIEK